MFDGLLARRRGASEVVGFILVFTLVMGSVVLVSVTGLETLQNARTAEQIDNAEQAFDVLANNVASVYSGDAPRRATELDLAKARLHTVDNVTINVTAVDSGGTNRASVNRSVRPILYRGQDDASLYYEAGAVIRTDGDAQLVRRAPPLVVEDDRAVVQIVALQSPSPRGVGSATVRVVATERERTLAIENTTGTYDTLYVNVTSPRDEAWETILTDAGFGGCVRGTDANGDRFVTCERAAGGSSYQYLYVVPTDIDVTLER